MTDARVVGAAVDVGATSVHLYVAALAGGSIEVLADESAFLGLGDRIDHAGVLGAAGRAELHATLDGFAATARDHGARDITFVGTEPLRRAGDAATICHEIAAGLGLALHVLGHAEEGLLTLLGVSEGRPVEHDLVVADIGGGSTEIVVVGPGHAPRASGLRIGSSRLTALFRHHDPPASAELDAMTAAANEAFRAAPAARPARLVVVGGTTSKLLRIAGAEPDSAVVDAAGLARASSLLRTLPAATLVERYAIRPARARILPAGACLVGALMRHYGMASIEILDRGVREGAVIAAARAGRAWRDRLSTLALGWDA